MEKRPAGLRARAARSLVVWLVAILLAVAMTWPLAAGIDHLGRTRSGDGRFAVWNVAWVAHALTTDPGKLYDANIFHPHKRALAYSEANIGAGLLAVPAWWLTRNPFTAHNVVVLFTFASSLVATWFLMRRLTGDSWAAATAAILYSFCPYIFSHTAHIQLLMSAGMPLSMLTFHRLIERPSPSRGAALGLALAATALTCAYYGIFAALMVGFATLFYAWTRRYWRSARYWSAIAIGAVVSLGIVVPFFLPYLDIQEETGFARSLDDAHMFRATLRSYLASSAMLHRWMLPLIREWNGEVLFPGFVTLVLGTIGAIFLLKGPARAHTAPVLGPDRETALLYGSIGVLSFWSSLGPYAGLYTVLYELIPVFSLLRAPARMGLVVMLCLAVFAAFGVRALRARSVGARAATVGAVAVAAALIDLAHVPFPWQSASPIPRSYNLLAALPRGAVAEFPFYHRRIDYHIHTIYMLNSTRHWQPLVNGYSDFIPPDFRPLAVRLASFPSRDAFEAMRERRVRYFTVNRRLYGGAMPEIQRRLEEFAPYVRLLTDDGVLLVFEVMAWPE